MKKMFSIVLITAFFIPCHAQESLRARTNKIIENEYNLLRRNITTLNKIVRRTELSEQDIKDVKSAGKRALIAGGVLILTVVGFKVYTSRSQGVPSSDVRLPAGPPPPLPWRPDVDAPPLPPRPQQPVQPSIIAPQVQPSVPSVPSVIEVPEGELPPQLQEEEAHRVMTRSELASPQPAPIISAEPAIVSSPPAPPALPQVKPVTLPGKSFAEQLAERQRKGLKKSQEKPGAPVQPKRQPRPAVDPLAELKQKQEEMRQRQQTGSPIKITRRPITLKLQAPKSPEEAMEKAMKERKLLPQVQQAEQQPSQKQSQKTQEELEEEKDWAVILTRSQEAGIAEAAKQREILVQKQEAERQKAIKKAAQQMEKKPKEEEGEEPAVTTSVLERFTSGIKRFFGARGGEESEGESTTGSSFGESHDGE